jgi:hypothetical protein
MLELPELVPPPNVPVTVDPPPVTVPAIVPDDPCDVVDTLEIPVELKLPVTSEACTVVTAKNPRSRKVNIKV